MMMSHVNEIMTTLLHLLFLSPFSHTHRGLSVRKMINCGAGVVYADYRGNVGVILFNFGSSDFKVNLGDRLAQLFLEQISIVLAVKGGG